MKCEIFVSAIETSVDVCVIGIHDTIMIMNYGIYFNEDSQHGRSSLCTEFNHMLYRLCIDMAGPHTLFNSF